ncbi:MAG TPA: hypothetical protein ENJ18_04090 [Nannocystis exedens]|nr:hypothetical protein [Nannocystis exedens]
MSALVATIAQIALLIGLVVALAYYLKLDPIVTKIALGIGIFAILVVTIINIVRRLKVPKGTPDPAKQARRDAKKRLREEAKVLRLRFRELVKHLRGQQEGLGIRYSEAQDRRAWWFVIGPQGQGKSTLLAAAADSEEVAAAGADVPRFFVTPVAVFIEMPAEYAKRPETALALPTFFRSLKRLRRQPIDGVLLVWRIDSLLAEHFDGAALVEDARGQIDRLSQTLEVQVPVIIAGSQLDALPGLGELCADREHVDPARALGIALPARLTGQATEDTASAHFSAPTGPTEWVRDRCFALVASSTAGHQSQARLFGFWQSFSELTERLSRLAGSLSSARLPGGDPLPLRGIYFTAAGAEGHEASIDPSLASMARELGGQLVGSGPSAPPRVFTQAFLGHELRRAGGYGRRSRPYRRRRGIAQGLFAGLALCVGVYVVVGVRASARRNTELLQSTADLAQEAASKVGPRLPKGRELRPYEAALENVERWRAETSGEGRDFGLFRPDLVRPAVIAATRASVCRGVVSPAVKLAEGKLRDFVRAFAEGGVPGQERSALAILHLQVFLMLTEGDDEPSCAPPLDVWSKSERGLIIKAFASRDSRLEALLNSYAELVGEHSSVPKGDGDGDFDLDYCALSGGVKVALRDADQERLVESVRGILAREEGEHRLVNDLLTSINENRDPWRLARITSSGRVHSRHRLWIDYAFTKKGWREFSERLTRQLRDPSSGSGWAVCRGDEGTEERCEIAMQIYASRYEKTWRDFLEDISVEQPTSISQAITVYKDLATERPFEAIWKRVASNTQGLSKVACMAPSVAVPSSQEWSPAAIAERLAAGTFANAGGSADGDDVTGQFSRQLEDRFRGFVRFGSALKGEDAPEETPLGKYNKRLVDLRAAADEAKQSPEGIGGLKENLEAAITELEGSLRNEELGGWNQTVEDLLKPPLKSLLVAVNCADARELDRLWLSEVIEPLRRGTTERYPFDMRARSDAQLSEVEILFHPTKGEIARFREANLESYAAVVGHEVVAANSGRGAARQVNPAVIRFLDASYQLGRLLYATNEQAEIAYDLHMGCTPQMAKVELSLGKNVLTYGCGDEPPKRVVWPGEPAAAEAKLKVTGTTNNRADISKQGDFALLQLMERSLSPHLEAKTGKIILSLDARGKSLGVLKMTVDPENIDGGNIFYGFAGGRTFLAPFRSPLFLDPPTSLFGGSGCGVEVSEP